MVGLTKKCLKWLLQQQKVLWHLVPLASRQSWRVGHTRWLQILQSFARFLDTEVDRPNFGIRQGRRLAERLRPDVQVAGSLESLNSVLASTTTPRLLLPPLWRGSRPEMIRPWTLNNTVTFFAALTHDAIKYCKQRMLTYLPKGIFHLHLLGKALHVKLSYL